MGAVEEFRRILHLGVVKRAEKEDSPSEFVMNAEVRRRSKWGQLVVSFLVLGLLVISGVAARAWYVFRDRNPGYSVALAVTGKTSMETPRPLKVGFGKQKITPSLEDPERPVWLAGFSNGRRATAVHDDLYATAIVVDDGYARLGLVVLDAIGLFHDDVIQIRSQITREWGLTYVIVCTTHNHSTPDLMGLWGPNVFRSGVDKRYRQHVIDQAVFALGDAVYELEPALMSWHHIEVDPEGLVSDTRKPEVFDADLRVLHFTHPETGATLGTLVGWANHPETPWSENTEITADFPGYLREALARGIEINDELVQPGLGGLHVFVNGALGGLMTTHPGTTVTDPYTGEEFTTPSHAKARALGHQLAKRVLNEVQAPPVRPPTSVAPITIHAKTLELPLENHHFFLASMLGLINRGHSSWQHVRTEVAFVTLGDVSAVTIPGEIYPELINGGIERSPGGDFDIDPVEVPPIRELMPGRLKFVWGLGNDEVGYIIPKSQWDVEPPYLYGESKSPYGEINSLGPNTAPLLHQAIRDLIKSADVERISSIL